MKKSINNCYELRVARNTATHLAIMIFRDYWKNTLPYLYDYIPSELSVKKSYGTWYGDDTQMETVTVFTFRFETGTVVKVVMAGTRTFYPEITSDACHSEWIVAEAHLRFYKCVEYRDCDGICKRRNPKELKHEIHLGHHFFRKEHWWRDNLQ